MEHTEWKRSREDISVPLFISPLSDENRAVLDSLITLARLKSLSNSELPEPQMTESSESSVLFKTPKKSNKEDVVDELNLDLESQGDDIFTDTKERICGGSLPSYNTFPSNLRHLRRLIPKKENLPDSIPYEEAYKSPRVGQTRTNPSIWTPPRKFRPRLLRRVYQRFWHGLVWTRKVDKQAARNIQSANKSQRTEDKGRKHDIVGTEEKWEKCYFKEAFPEYGDIINPMDKSKKSRKKKNDK